MNRHPIRHPLIVGAAALGLLLGVASAPANATSVQTACDAMQHGVDKDGKTFGTVINKDGKQIGAVDAKQLQQPVLLIHGFGGDGISTWTGTDGTAARLEADGGYFVARFDYKLRNNDWIGDGPPSVADQLANVIHCMAQQSREAGGSGKVILVGYSMGGLAAQAAISKTVEGRPVASDVGDLASIGTPWQGVDQGRAQFASSLNEAFCKLILLQRKGLFTTIPDLQACALSGVLIPQVRTAAGKAVIPNADGSLSDQMKKLPKLPSGFPVFTVAGDVARAGVVFAGKRTWSGNDGLVGTGSAISPPFADSHTPQPPHAKIDCAVSGQFPPKDWKSWEKVPKAELDVSFEFLTAGCGHVDLSHSPDVAKALVPVLWGWRAGMPSSITGTYTLNRRLNSCVTTCHLNPLVLRIDCQQPAGNCTVATLNTFEGLPGWQGPHPLSSDGTAWHSAGRDDHAIHCASKPFPGSITLELKVVSGRIVNGVWKADHLKGTYTAQADSVCPNSGGRPQASETLSSVPLAN